MGMPYSQQLIMSNQFGHRGFETLQAQCMAGPSGSGTMLQWRGPISIPVGLNHGPLSTPVQENHAENFSLPSEICCR